MFVWGFSKCLNGNIGPSGQKVVQCRKNINSVEHVRKAAVEIHAMNAGPDAKQMFPCGPLECFDNFRVALRSLLIEAVAFPPGPDARDFIHGGFGVRPPPRRKPKAPCMQFPATWPRGKAPTP